MSIVESIVRLLLFFFFFNDTATTEIYTLSLHDALPISARPVRVVEEPAHAVPCLPAVGGPEERRGLDATVEGVGLGGAAGDDLPDLLERQSALRREFDVGLLGLRPRPTPVVRRDEHRAPVHTRRARPDPPAARPAVMGQGVHGPAGEIGPPDFPGRPCGGGAARGDPPP